ncbi:hypothetical protein DY000_02024172 [Brassica cretica]|uniref:Uncharacterized protein n=1 Tax=Brassica cretica TaxID=69181 RepID=A0ABQ7EAF8_BRACR|nr:hypothetical protein DY000_02024172 [Brassica cretica]
MRGLRFGYALNAIKVGFWSLSLSLESSHLRKVNCIYRSGSGLGGEVSVGGSRRRSLSRWFSSAATSLSLGGSCLIESMPIFLSFFGSIRSISGDGALLDGDGALSRWRRSSLSVATELKWWLSSNQKLYVESLRLGVMNAVMNALSFLTFLSSIKPNPLTLPSIKLTRERLTKMGLLDRLLAKTEPLPEYEECLKEKLINELFST